MERIIEFYDFLEDILDEEDFVLNDGFDNEILLHADEIFSSEFLEKEMLLERKELDEEIYREYRKIRSDLVKKNQTKEVTERYFTLEIENLERKLNEDKDYVRYIINRIVEKLQVLNEENEEPQIVDKKTEKIKKLKSYQNKTIRKINEEIEQMKVFLSNNPKILVI